MKGSSCHRRGLAGLRTLGERAGCGSSPFITVVAAATVIGVAPSSSAAPPSFPDFGKYTPVNSADYAIELANTGGPSIPVVYFLTPDGIPCTFTDGSAGCIGDNLPGIQSKDKNPYTYVDTVSGIQRAGSTQFVNNSVHGTPIKQLPPMHSIAVGGVTCGVDGAGLTACKDSENEGFILSPSWSGWLKHTG